MATLTISALLTLLDSIAAGVARFESGIGVSGSVANTTAKGAANNVATLLAVADATVETDLLSVFGARAAAVVAASLYGALYGAALQRALDRHYGSVAGLNAALATAGVRVHPDLRKIGFQIDAPNAFCATVVDPVASYVVTGAGAGTFTAGSDLDTTVYGKANLSVVVTHAIGGVNLVATLSLKRIEGTRETRTVTMPALSLIGASVAIGTPGADMYVGVTSVTVAGGTAGDAFKVVSGIERTVAL